MSNTTHRLRKVALVAGCLGLAVAVLAANQAPAAGYELSLYAATPLATWLGLAVALATSGFVALTTPAASRVRDAAVVVVTAAVTVFAMPVVRGYEFYGAGDSLSHVGWARELASGALEPTNLLYPGVHSLTVFVSKVADVPLTLANTYVVLVAFPLVFVLFVPLATRLLAGTPRAYAVGLLAAVLFVPINNVSVHPNAHPASQAILMFAFVLYLALAYAVGSLHADRKSGGADRDRSALDGVVSGTGALLALAAVAIVLVHPQQALNVGLVLVAVSGVQFLGRRYTRDHPVATHRPLYVHTAVLIAAFLAWAPRFERAQGAFVSTVRSILRTGPTAGDVVSQKSASLTTVGGSVVEIFLKLFGTAAVFSLLAGALAVLALRYHRRSDADTLVAYVTAGFVPLVAVFLVVLAADSGDMYFRYQGFIMVPVTVVGAAALARATHWAAARGWRQTGAVTAVVLLVLAPVGLVAVHPSPYMYQPSKHVTESQIEGYGAAFEHRQEDVPFTGLRGGPRRFVDYHYGTEQARNTLEFPGYEAGTRPAVFRAANYTEAFGQTRYLLTTDAGRRVEVQLYEGFRYPASGYRALETTPSVSRVRVNDGVQLYLVDGGDE